RTPGACSTASTARESTESGTTRLNCIVGPTATVKFVIPRVLRRLAKTASAVSTCALSAPTGTCTTADMVCVGRGVGCGVGSARAWHAVPEAANAATSSRLRRMDITSMLSRTVRGGLVLARRLDGQMRRQGHDEARATRLRVHAHVPAVSRDDRVADVEAQPRSDTWRLGREERLEDARLRLGRDPWAVVA